MMFLKALFGTAWDWLKTALVNIGLTILVIVGAGIVAFIFITINHFLSPVFAPFAAWLQAFVSSIAFPITILGIFGALLLLMFSWEVIDTYKEMKRQRDERMDM